ncbi:MAG: prephenate dehydrogenase/arogenate dehydrogenase family protein, partial [Spirochaetales bacterium]
LDNRTHRPFALPKVKQVRIEALGDCDTLFLCTAISAMEQVLQEIAPLLKPNCLVADTCSVKIYPIQMMEKYLPSSVSILGTHPMFGPDSAKAGLQGLPMILTPVRLDSELYKFWENTFLSLGLRVVQMSAVEHDREAAFTQGVAHFIGRVLKDMDLQPSPIATVGYRKLLEIMEQTCNDPWQLFLDLQSYNPYTPEMREKLQRSLKHILSKL